MRHSHSSSTTRVLALATLTALIAGTVGPSVPAVAGELAADPFSDSGPKRVEPGSGPLSGTGSWGVVDPKLLRQRELEPPQRRVTPLLSWPSAVAAGRSTRQPAAVPAPPDPVEYTPTLNPPAARPGNEGFAYGTGPWTSIQPPDPWVAVGPDHVIQTVNSSMQILDRSGNSIMASSLIEFFQVPDGYESADGRVFFDSLHQRWVMTALVWRCHFLGGTGYIVFNVSTTTDPTDPWLGSYLRFDGYLPDYPAPGTSTDNLAFASNLWHMVPGGDCLNGATFYGADIEVMDWRDILAGPALSNAVTEIFFGTNGDYFTPRIAVQAPAASPTLHTVVQWDDPADGIGIGVVVALYFKILGSAVADNVEVTAMSDLNAEGFVAPFAAPPPPHQPGMAIVTSSIDSRPTDAIWQSGKMTWVSNAGCTPTGDVSVQSCVRVTQIDTRTIPPEPIQDFLIAAADEDNYFGGIGQALDGTLDVVWTTSSGAVYPSSYTAYQLPADPDNSLSSPELLKAGVAPAFSGQRWGDYSGVAQDPQVPNAVWQANAYSGGGPLWKTFISQIQTGGTSYVPITPFRIVDSRFDTGVAGSLTANVPRTFQVAGVGGAEGIPADAVAVTGNVTVVGQNWSGYVSVTPTATANPTSSTINFPVGDNRANNVTLPLSTAGKLSAVFKAPAGKTTDLLVDITGYFLAGPEDATYSTMAPARVLDSRPAIGIGLSGPFLPNAPRKLTIAGSHGIPADAVAITGNLTVVGQTRAGYLSVTSESVVNPQTSTLNFPMGDTRANGVSVPLNGTGGLWIVFKASGGATNVILDVTGYYRADPSGLLFYPLTPGRLMDTRAGVNLSGLHGAFRANLPRRLQVAGHWGVPVGSQAVTGNLTVVNQTAAGYVSATLTSQVNPMTSVINFPLGDIRANGVTLPLTAGRSWFVYKAASGTTAHLILDVTGYFD